jgi:hypothetical protein
MTNKNFTKPVLPVIVDCKDEIQVWHIFAVAKNHEPSTLHRIRGVIVCENGIESHVDKELVVLTGNIPSNFISALSKTSTNINDIDMASFVYPHVRINREDVTIECV